ncbi:MAG: hypothetical protein IJW90_04140, partial [Clostridia bacterium]|nr:hypothetical protein [Clostridia bacterium]
RHCRLNNNLPLYFPSGDEHGHGECHASVGRHTAANNNLSSYHTFYHYAQKEILYTSRNNSKKYFTISKQYDIIIKNAN